MNQLFNGRSIQERGTLCQLKAYFNHRNATTDVMNSFNDTENFIRFVTEAHIVYAAMHKLGLHNIDGIPTTSDGKKPKADKKGTSRNCVMIWWTVYGVFLVLKKSTLSWKPTVSMTTGASVKKVNIYSS